MWGKGTPRFEGRRITVPAATCYPRPLQEHVPILVGGSGERRTLRLVARHADACNLFGDPATVARKVDVLREHCAAEERDPATVTVTNLSEAAVLGGSAAPPSATRPSSARSRSTSVATASGPRPASRRPSSPSTSTARPPRSRPSPR